MTAFRIERFGGMLPAWGDRLLPDGQAAGSVNGYLFSGELTGWRQPKLLRQLNNSAAKYAYRIPTTTISSYGEPVFSTDIAGQSTWLEYTDPDTTVLRTPIVNDQYQRYYTSSPSQTPQYNTYSRILANQPFFQLGIPNPACAPIVEVQGGGASAQLGYPNPSPQPNTAIVEPNSVYLVSISPTAIMSLNDVAFSVETTNNIANYYAVIYSDNNGSPNTLIAQGTNVIGTTAGTPGVSVFVNPPTLNAGTIYWVGIATDSQLTVDTGNTSATSVTFENTFTNGAPPLAPGPGSPNYTSGVQDLQMWADLSTTDVIEARAYLYTWVSAYGEEGPPSPPTLVNGWSNGTWTIQLFTPAVADMGTNRNITTLRLYRTVSATGGQTVYFQVAELPVGTPYYVDNQSDTTVATNNQLPSTNWFPPPQGLQGMYAMPNGMFVGFRNNEVWFCEPYRPHAWPPGYVLTTEYPIVGMGVTGTTVVAATADTPYCFSGVSPGTMVPTKCVAKEPCISRASVLGTDAGVYYMSKNGLMLVNTTAIAQNLTELWITRERWAGLAPMKNTRAIHLASCYFCFGTTNGPDTSVAQQGFIVELAADNASFSIWPQPGGHRLGFDQLSAPNGYNIDNVLVDPWTGIGLLVQNGQVYYYDFTDQTPTMVPYTWTSKIYQQNNRKNFEAMKIFFKIPPNTPVQGTRNQKATNDPSWNTLGPNQYGIVRVYGDGNLVTTREIYSSGELLRILSGFKYEHWQFQFTGRVVITNVQVATSAKELSKV